nr:hypothetical protein [uncultured Flavobacterium sp.]
MSSKKILFGKKVLPDFSMYDIDFQNVLAVAFYLGFTLPDATLRAKINQLFLDLKANNLWTNQDYILNFAYNNIALAYLSLINWKNASFTLASVVGGMNYNVNGYKGNGTDGSILTPFNLLTHGVNYTLNNAGRGAVVYVDGTVTAANRLIDYNTSGFSRMTNSNATQQRINSGATSLPTAVDLTGSGYKGIFRLSSTSVELNNKTVRTARTSNSTSVDSSGTMRLFAQGTANWGDVGISFYHIGSSLTNTEVQNLRTIYNAYLTSIGLAAVA